MQYVAVQFNPWDRRTYTYHNEGEPFIPGEEGFVETARGVTPVTVVSTSDEKPPFDTKPITRQREDEPEPEEKTA